MSNGMFASEVLKLNEVNLIIRYICKNEYILMGNSASIIYHKNVAFACTCTRLVPLNSLVQIDYIIFVHIVR